MSEPPRPDPSTSNGGTSARPATLASGLTARAHHVEHVVEETLEHGIAAAERTIVRRFGLGALHAVRQALKFAFWSLVAAYFAFGTLLLFTRYVLLPSVDDWRPQLQALTSRALNAQVTIGRIDAGWRAFNPHLALDDVVLAGPRGGAPLALPRVEATVSWLSLLHLEPRFVSLRVLSPQVTVTRLAGGEVAVAGFVFEPGKGSGDDSPALDWLLAQRRVAVRNAQLVYRDERRDEPRALQLDDVHFMIEHTLGGHRLGLQARPAAAVAAPLDVRGNFRTSPFARPSAFRQWKGELYAQLDYADLAELSRFLELPVQTERALGAVRAWLGFEDGAVTRMTADVALQDVVTRLADGLEPLQLASLQGRFAQRRWGDFWPVGRGGQEFALTRTTFRTAGGLVFPPLDLKLRVTRAAGSEPRRTDLEASQVDLASLGAVAAQLPLPDALRAGLARHAPRGTVSALSASWPGEAPAVADVTLRARFAGLASAAQPAADVNGHPAIGLPGFENLAGTVRMERGGGTLELAATDATLVFPGVFRQPRLALKQLGGSFTWKHDAVLEVRVDGFRAANDDAEIAGAGAWRATSGGPGVLDVGGRIVRASAPAAHRYIPLVAGAATLDWLQHALVAGRLADGTFRVRGDLARFPFMNPADGEFRIGGRVTAATLDVHPVAAPDGSPAAPGAEWPLLTGIDADLLFERAAMTITAQRGQAYGARIEQATARIPHLGAHPVLTVRGQASGALPDMIRYVNDSPVRRWIGGITDGAVTQGNARLDLRLEIPLDHAVDSKVEGALALAGNTVTLADVPTFTRATGTVNFNERGVRIANLSTGLLGGQARLDAVTRPDGAMVFTAGGSATPGALRPLVPVTAVQRLIDRAQGSARYQATLTVKDGTDLRIDSDLAGLAIDGIAPLRKTAAETLPLRIERSSTAAGEETRVQAGQVLGVRVQRRPENGTLRLARGVVALNEPANLPERGLLVLASLPRVDVDAWASLVAPDPPPARPGRGAPPPAAEEPTIDLIALRTPELLVYGQRARNVTLGASRLADGGYAANLSSDGASGYLTWRPTGPQALGQVTAHLSRLVIEANRERDVMEALRAPPKQIPSVEIAVDQFELSGMKLGRLDLVAQNVGTAAGAAWRVSRLDVVNPDMKLSATGEWTPAGAGGTRRTRMKFGLDAFDAGAVLGRMGMPDALARGAGRLDGEVEWTGSPLDIDYPTLSGRVDLALDKGRFLKADAGNAARLLALLSLQSLGRTLADDGGGQFAEGFAFNSIRADATIERGVLKTDSFRMNGTNAAVMMSGTIDLRNETQQLAIVVLPQIDASTAALALGVANPVLGLGTFLAQYVLRDPLSKAFALQYDVTGTWADPKVTRRSRITPTPEQAAK